jgi:hypothetical protein
MPNAQTMIGDGLGTATNYQTYAAFGAVPLESILQPGNSTLADPGFDMLPQNGGGQTSDPGFYSRPDNRSSIFQGITLPPFPTSPSAGGQGEPRPGRTGPSIRLPYGGIQVPDGDIVYTRNGHGRPFNPNQHVKDGSGQILGPPGSVGQPGFIEGLIPIWGPLRSLVDDYETGHYGDMAIDAGFLALDATIVLGAYAKLGTALAKLGKGIAKEGIYEFTAASGKTYLGQSANIAKRIARHLSDGKLLRADLASLKTMQVLGGKTAREIAEQLRILALGGIDVLENVRNPIGRRRAHLLPTWARILLGY